MKTEKENRLSISEKLCYSAGDCGSQIYVTLCTYFLTGFYTDTVGIAAAAIGTMMLFARLFDGTSDLIMGAILDKIWKSASVDTVDSAADGDCAHCNVYGAIVSWRQWKAGICIFYIHSAELYYLYGKRDCI